MSVVPQDCFAEEDTLTDAEREAERWAAAVRMWTPIPEEEGQP